MEINNRGPETWGPPAWEFLEHIALGYYVDPTLEEQESFRTFFGSLISVIPCGECAEHYHKNMKQHPIRLQNKYELITWLIEMHNLVNIKNKKSFFTLQDFLFKHKIILQDLFID